jgi:DNA-binding NarL/FixJ family response regulator
VTDDQPIDRQGLVALLRTQLDFELVGEATNGAEAVERCRALRPDVLVLDLRMPCVDGIRAIPAVHSASPGTKILAVAERGEGRCLVLNPPTPGTEWKMEDRQSGMPVADCLQVAVAQGALGAIRRSAEPEDLYRAVRAVASGNAWYELRTASRLLEQTLNLTDSHATPKLSTRELDVARLIAEGRSNKEIGSAMGVSEPTVKKRVGRILDKLGLKDRLQVGLYVARNPLVFGPHGPAAR